MRARAASLTPERPLNTKETALFETCARSATSPMVARRALASGFGSCAADGPASGAGAASTSPS
jgi:hypothetical protein